MSGSERTKAVILATRPLGEAELFAVALAMSVATTSPTMADPVRPPPAAKAPACWAIDKNGVKISEARGATASDCSFELRAPLRKHFCKAGSKGKTFTFVVRFEHRLGARTWPEEKDSFYCASEVSESRSR